jgi:hypothetical protein
MSGAAPDVGLFESVFGRDLGSTPSFRDRMTR